MPEQHHSDSGMHMANDMWHYFSIHHWWSWIIIVALIVSVIWLIKTFTNKKNNKEK